MINFDIEEQHRLHQKRKSGLGRTLEAYNLFSVFLEWSVIDPEHIDISCVPMEYLQYLAGLKTDRNDAGDLMLIVMLFVEHFQKNITGNRKVRLEGKKYIQMAKQFSLLCQLEIQRRFNKFKEIKISHLFDPNVKTQVHLSQHESIEPSLKQLLEENNILLS